MHRTLVRQLDKYADLTPESVVSPWKELLSAVSTTYDDFDRDKQLIERSLEISSHELRRLISTLQATLDATNEGILVMDDKGRMANHNKRFTEIWSIPDDIMNTHDATKALEYAMQLVLNPVPFRESVEEALNKNDKETVYVVHFKDGRVIELRSKPHFLDGESAGTIWSSRDITQSVKAEEDLKAKLAALELLNKSMVDRELKMIELKKKIPELSKDTTL